MESLQHRNWVAQFCRDHLAELLVTLLLAIASGIGTVIVRGDLWARSIDTSIALLSEKVGELKESSGERAQHLIRHDGELSAHGERLSRLEAIQK